MKQKTFTLFILVLLGMSGLIQAQNTINVNVTANVFTVSNPPITADFSKTIKIVCASPPANFMVQKVSDNMAIPAKQEDGSYEFKVNKVNAKSVKVKITGDHIQDFPLEISNATRGKDTKLGSNSNAIAVFSSLAEFNNPYKYDRKGDRAHFFFDQNGFLIGPAPVNIDADDFIDVWVAVPESSKDDYSIEMVGEYNASDLSIRPHEPIANGAAQGTGGEKAAEKFTYIHQIFGPFTSDKATIKIYGKDTDGEAAILKQVDVKINKLYNVGIGASFVSTSLENPNFDIFPINGTANNTIRKINDGKRTMVTFNVIYYWKPTVDWITGKLKGSDHITRGRDVLKEATFWERLNPIFGVALSDKWKENFFLGGNFEFARGGSISAGWHYGKVQSLVDDKFKLGEDVFTGTKDEIKLTNSWKWNSFIAITVDTRIFNALFSHN